MTTHCRFEGKVALITGGASGIGKATARRLAGEGAAVAIADVDEAGGRATSGELEQAGGRSVFVPTDVTRAADAEKMVALTVSHFGRLDVLVASAGKGAGGTVDDTSEEDWDGIVDLDLKGVFLSAKFAIPEMRKSGGGAVVCISSVGGLRGNWGGPAFGAAKGGVINLTRHLAVAHAADNIRANCICPGVIETPLTAGWLSDPEVLESVVARHPIGRLGTPEEVAAAAAFLASDEASFITGAILAVDGGHLAMGK